MKGRLVGALFLLVASLSFSAKSSAEESSGRDPALAFQDVFVRFVPDGAQSTAAYLTIINKKDKSDRLVSASSSVVEHVELHKIMNDHGLRRMHEVEEIVVPPHATVPLTFGTYHLMLVGLKQPLVVGGKVPLVLHFSSAGKVRLLAPVVDIKVGKTSAVAEPGRK